MTDITKCVGHNCTDREKCFRYMAPNGVLQSWCDFSPGTPGTCDTKTCASYLEIWKDKPHKGYKYGR